ncbi:hypothetical protein BS17DRAFT_881599 [Gyrodon lividus]|nr:hypothetical protein BS17DRAFT_881599 [Gyrodon lividus]
MLCLGAIMQVGALPGEKVESQLKSMKVGAQNAAVVFRKQQNQMLFEAFEISPKAEAVMGRQGKLVCSYPGLAVEIPDEVFRYELVNSLAHMDHDTIADAVPIIESNVEETRDTVDSRYITGLLTSILRGVGRPAEIVRVSKRIGDDVVWTNSLLPWRRSFLWLIVRVSLQTILDQTALGWHAYKVFMIFFMHELAQKAIEADMSSELLHSMSTKTSRCLMKLGSPVPDWFSYNVLQTCTSI